ncbi:MAG: TylF/MycF/NovP-related O-methyltransferase, partial [Hoeflea sp.]|nr:TylF/MycF/NovP-related O-methyltransferase [Hoeflea sp.]
MDDEIAKLLETEAGRAEYWSRLGVECASSSLIELLEAGLKLDGDVIECGVFRGNSVRRISRKLVEFAPSKQIFACDSFEGFPEDRVAREDTSLFRFRFKLRRKFKHATDVPARLTQFFEAYGVNGHVVKGFFSDTLPALRDRKYCFVHVDCDIYQSHLDCLNLMYDRLVPGGIMVFDDYAQPKWPGASQAVNEFFAGRQEKPEQRTSRM